MKHFVWIVSFVLVVVLCAIYSFRLQKQLNVANESILRYGQESVLMHNSVQNIINCRKMEAQSEGLRLSPDVIVTNTKGDISPLVDIITTPTLVYRFTEMHCNSCIEHGLRLLKETCSSTKLPVMVLCRYESIRLVRAVSNSYGIEFPIYNISERLSFPLDDMSTSYFFIIDENLKCHGFQSFIKEVPIITETYLNGLCSSQLN